MKDSMVGWEEFFWGKKEIMFCLGGDQPLHQALEC
jgi:hypothetical protein